MAIALGNIGEPAKHTVPALEKAFVRAKETIAYYRTTRQPTTTYRTSGSERRRTASALRFSKLEAQHPGGLRRRPAMTRPRLRSDGTGQLDNLVAPENRDLGLGVTELAQDGLRRRRRASGTGSRRCGESERCNGVAMTGTRPTGDSISRTMLRARICGWASTSAMPFTCRRGAARLRAVQPFSCGARGRCHRRAFEHIAVLPACLRGLEPRVFEKSGRWITRGRRLPSRGGDRDAHVFPVAGHIRPVRRDVMMPHPNPGRLFALVPVVVREISEPGKRGLEHGDVDYLPRPVFSR